MKVRFLGHACFEIEDAGVRILTDPYLDENPLSPVKSSQVSADYILVSHAHSDHLGEAVSIAKASQGLIVSTAEVAGKCSDEGAKAHALHIGGKHAFDFGYVRTTLALHGSGIPGGHACGFIVNLFGRRFYFAGDTGLFGDMRLLGEIEPLDLALLPIGDNYTMGPDDALLAVKMLNPKTVIPMHYNTWPVIQADPHDFKRRVESETKAKVVILEPGKETEI